MSRVERYVAETERGSVHDPLSQGNIIQFKATSLDEQTPELGVIINADCDLRHSKIDGVIAYLPVYSFETYLKTFWARTYVDTVATQALDRLRVLCGLLEAEVDDLKSWISTERAEVVSDSLVSTIELKKGQAEQVRSFVSTCSSCLQADKSHFDRFIDIAKTYKDPQVEVERHMTAALKGMGEGHLFVNEIVGFQQLGFVVRMRRIYSLPAESCYQSYSDWAAHGTSGLTAFRSCRFSPIYKFKLAQTFGHQFARVGLPDESRDFATIAIGELSERLLGS